MQAEKNAQRKVAIKRVIETTSERVSDPHIRTAERFARLYYAGVAADDLTGKDAEDLYGAMLSHWQLAQRRKPETPNIRVYNPTPETNGWRSPHTVVEIVTGDMPFLVDSISMELNRRGLTIHL
ncbi:MAG TPA: hypothetical protein VKB53_10235, partial [Gammaproteobacteria bacterium]|nr:hypothetical protein [Gammaproteobacteria bacterium]